MLFLIAVNAYGQSPENQVRVGQKLQLLVPGAIAGFARPGRSAKVEVDDGVVIVTGKKAGTTEIVLITKNSTLHLTVTVTVLPRHDEPPIPAGRARRLPFPRKREQSESGKSTLPDTSPMTTPPATPPQAVTPQITESDIENLRPNENTPPAAEPAKPAGGSSTSPVNSYPDVNAKQPSKAVTPVRSSTASKAGIWSSTGTAGISLQERQTLRVPASGATAAYAIESLHVDVTLDQGFAVVTGKFAGHSQLILVTDAGIQTIPIEVTGAPPLYPEGFIPPVPANSGRVNGEQEIRYISDQQQVQNLLDYTVQGPERSTQLHLLTSTLAEPGLGGSHILLPSAFFRIRTPDWDVTLLDQPVTTSPLTLHGETLRGLHVSKGRWRFHGGYSSLAMFHDFLLPVQLEGSVGASYVAPLTENSRLSANAYYFFAPAVSATTSHRGTVASLAYEFQRKHGPSLLAELGASRGGLGGAFDLQQTTARDTLMLNFRDKPQAFPSLSIDNLPGLQSALDWTHQFNLTFANSVNISEQRLLLPLARENNFIATENARFRITTHWSASSGVSQANFSQTGAAGAYSVGSLDLPQNLNFDLAHFGTGFQYQYSRNSQGFAPGNQFRQTFRASLGTFSASAFVQRQTQALSVESLFSEIPALQSELQSLGLSASTPQQVQTLLQDTSFLQALGLSSGSRPNLVPSQIQYGGNLNWSTHGKRAQQLNLGVIHNQDEILLGHSTDWTVNGSYNLQLTRTLSVSSSFALLHVSAAGTSQTYPQVQFGIRHVFSTLPSFLSGYKSGIVSGIIFEDESGQGEFRKGLPAISGVEVVLDNSERTTTDRNGFYSFRHVKEGDHTVEIHFQSSKPFWFTGPSRFVTSINQQKNIGIRFAPGELVGYLKNDAGVGVDGVHVVVAGNNQRLDTQSDADGRFAVSGLAAGDYDITVNPDTLPAGYLLEELKPQRVSIESSAPGRADFRIRAMRSITGTVTVYDTTLGKYVPAVGVPVQLRQLAKTASTNAAGKFDFQDLPEGEVVLSVGSGDTGVNRNVTVPPEPARIRVDVQIGQLQAER